MQFYDALTLDAPRRTKDGFLVVRAKAARLGVYDYLGAEVDPEGKHFKASDTVKVLRDENTVFDERSVKSFIGKPITDNHPVTAVTADNWRQHARGTVMGAMRDGDYLAFDLMVTDAEAVRKIEDGKRELSNGYAADLEFGDFTAADGTKCQARQASISGNHVALVDHGRAGSNCAIKDGDKFALCDANPAALAALTMEKQVKKIVLDGLQVDLADADAVAAAIDKLQTKITDGEKALTDAKSAHDKEMAAKDAEIDKLKGQVVDQAKIDALADAKATVVADAKKIVGDKLGDTAGKTVAEVRRMAVAAKLGDAAVTDKSDDYIEARFDGLKDGGQADPIAQNLRDRSQVTTDAEAVFLDTQRKLSEKRRNAWKSPATGAAH